MHTIGNFKSHYYIIQSFSPISSNNHLVQLQPSSEIYFFNIYFFSVKNFRPHQNEELDEDYEPIESVEVDFEPTTRATRPPKKIVTDSHDTNYNNDIGKENHNPFDDINEESNKDDSDTNKPNKPRSQEEAIDSEAEKRPQEEAVDSEAENGNVLLRDIGFFKSCFVFGVKG